MYRILVIILIFIAASCSSQKNLQKSFIGKPTSVLKEQFGSPETILDQGDEKVYVYKRIKKLKSTEISQGKLTLDPIISPKVKKTEHFYFTVKNGKIVKVKLEQEYKR